MNDPDDSTTKIWRQQTGTSTRVKPTDDGGLLFDYYDWGAESFWGGEIAYTLTLPPASVSRLKQYLQLSDDTPVEDVVKAVDDRIAGFHGFKSLLKNQKIPADIERDPFP